LSLCEAMRLRTETWNQVQVVIMAEDADPVIELDEPGIELLRALAGPRSQFRVAKRPDGSISLHPMSAHDTELWQSGLVSTIVENFSSAELMIRLKADKL
jgi:hypothetical protein